LHLLGVICLQAGKHDTAIGLIKRAVTQNPAHPVYHFNLGLAYQERGQLDAAVTAYLQAIGLRSSFAEAQTNLGNALRALGRYDEAIHAHRQAICIKPDYAEAHSNLGAVFRDQGKFEDAAASHRRAIALRHDYPEGYSNLGTALHDLGKLDEAIAAYRQAISIRPDFADAYTNLAAALCDQHTFDEAVAAYRQAIRIDPNLAGAHVGLGSAWHRLGKLEEAISAYQQAILIEPNNAEAHANIGVTRCLQGRTEEGIAAYRQAIVLKPDIAETHKNLALALREIGRLSESRSALEEAIRLDPHNTQYKRYLGEMMHPTEGDTHLADLERLAEDRPSLSIDAQIELHFALARAHENRGQHAKAFQDLLDGNALKRAQITYDESATLNVLDRVKSVFTAELLSAFQNGGHPSPIPIFIFGMPRSGSTLVEQILASHSEIFGGGELAYFQKAANGIRPRYEPSFPEHVSRLTKKDFHDLGGRYLADLTALAPAAHVTDKMPANFIFAGLIHLALPNAIMIHTVRDPVDTCLSCFSNLFAAEQNHTYNLAELGRYYRCYQALMEHWQRVLPIGRILEVRYEDVVADLESQGRRIIGHCGLDWDPSCLAFHKTQRAVRTASSVQVRQPLYDTAIGRWRAYESFLEPLLRELDLRPST